MDSITQVVLGAACGEVVLGKKAGNRAMLWGGIAGTIPDLDIMAYFFTDDMTALAFHRGISHSFFFAVTAPFVFGWLVDRFYKSGLYQQKLYKGFAATIWLIIFGLIAFGINYIPISSEQGLSLPTLIITLSIFTLLCLALWRKYFRAQLKVVSVSRKEWVLLFFWAILTHPLLDSCTAYGTQLFQPFSDYRVALNNISVADPVYTLPFLICMIIAGLLTRTSKSRKYFTYAGIGISSLYLAFTFYNKYRVDQIFESSLKEHNIAYTRYMAVPTILNNILWQGVAETDSAYYHGMYSFLDKEPRVIEFKRVEKNHHLIDQYADERAIKILKWFSNDYYNISTREDGRLQFNDLRYGSRSSNFDGEEDYIFKFILEEKDGVLSAEEARAEPKEGEFSVFFDRVKGI